jgi:hypothetical protein
MTTFERFAQQCNVLRPIHLTKKASCEHLVRLGAVPARRSEERCLFPTLLTLFCSTLLGFCRLLAGPAWAWAVLLAFSLRRCASFNEILPPCISLTVGKMNKQDTAISGQSQKNHESGHYVVTSHRPGGVLLSCRCSFLAPGSLVSI